MVRSLAVIPLVLAFATVAGADPAHRIRAEVVPPNKDVLREILASNLDVSHGHGGSFDMLLSDAELAELRAMGCEIQILNENVYDGLRGGFLPQYVSNSEAIAALNAFAATYPGLAAVSDIGNTHQLRDVLALKISDNVAIDEDEPEVLYMGNHHAREMISVIIPLAIADSLLSNYGSDPRFTEWVNEREIWIVPVVNPDGLQFVEDQDQFWRKNRRNNGGSFGVDPNRNYTFQWGHDNIGSSNFPSSDIYRGPSAGSEPENQAIMNLVNGREFKFALSYHSFGNWWLWGLGYKPAPTPDEDIFLGYGTQVSALNGYVPGNPAAGVIYLTNGDAGDWLYGDPAHPKVFGMTPEVGNSNDYFNPPASRIPQLVAENMEPAWIALENADRPGRLAPPGQPTLDVIPPNSSGDYVVTWSPPTVADTEPVVYELVEKTGPATVTFGFESGAGAFNTDGWTISNVRKFAGIFSLYSGNADGLDRVCLAREARVVQPGDNFSFRAWYNTESGYDYFYAVVSTDGGRSFAPLAGTNTTMLDPNGRNADNGITGTSGGTFMAMTFSLSSYVGQTVWLGFRYNTDEGTTGEGVYVDEVNPVATYATSTILSSTIGTTSFPITGRSDGTYWYVVRGKDAELEWGYVSAPQSAEVLIATSSVDVPPAARFALESSRPNPFSGSTVIRFSLPAQGTHSLVVYDVAGRAIRTLSRGNRTAGTAQVSWDGRNEDGIPVPSGVYFYRLESNAGRLERRTVLLR